MSKLIFVSIKKCLNACKYFLYQNHKNVVGASNVLKRDAGTQGQDDARIAREVHGNSHQQREPSEVAAVKA